MQATEKSTMHRRAVLLAAGAVAALPAVAAPAGASPRPVLRRIDWSTYGAAAGFVTFQRDAGLVRICAEHIANRDAYNTGAEPNGDGPLEAAYLRTFRAISDAEPTLPKPW